MNRQRLIVIIFLALFLCSLIYAYIQMPRQKTVVQLKYQPGMAAQAVNRSQKGATDNVRIRMDLLETRKERALTGGRNIFYSANTDSTNKKMIPLPLPPPPPDKKNALPSPALDAKPAVPAVTEPTPFQREMATFTFLGFLKKEEIKTIFLSNGKEIFLVKKGDKIAGKYEVTSLTDESLAITSVSDGGEIVIPLIENKPLAAAKK